MGSPLGNYATIVAAVVAVGTIAAAIVAHLINVGDPFLDNIALIAIGAVFGNAAAVNGTKRDLTAVHTRLDAAHIPGATGTG
jgi:hypothetical protein